MLKCSEITHLASDYLDKNLGWKESFSVKMHIFMCIHCQRFIRHLLSTIHIVQRMERQSAAPGEIKDIVTRISGK